MDISNDSDVKKHDCSPVDKIKVSYTFASGKRSKIWDHFCFATDIGNDGKETQHGSPICRHCRTCISVKNGSTSAMCRHLKRKHCDLFPTPKQGIKRRQFDKSFDNREIETETDNDDTILSDINHDDNSDINLSYSTTVNKLIAYHIAKDNRPIYTVEMEGFNKLIMSLCPSYQMPSRYIINKQICELYDTSVLTLKESLRASVSWSLTTAVWKSYSNTSYATYTVYYINDEWNLKCSVLQTLPISDSHTSDDLAKDLLSVIRNWELSDNIMVTTDNAENIVKACTILVDSRNIKANIKCLSDSINLSVNAGFENIDQLYLEIIKKMRSFILFLNRSTSLKNQLSTKTDLTLIMDVKTRWVSTYEMIVRFIKLYDILSLLFSEKHNDKLIGEFELKKIKCIIPILKPLKHANEILCAQNMLTASIILPMKETILDKLLLSKTEDSGIEKFKRIIFENLKNRYISSEEMNLLKICTFLDPRFKEEYNDVDSELLLSLYNTKEARDLIEIFPTTRSNSVFDEFFGRKQIFKLDESIEDEIVKYKSDSEIQYCECPLEWWKRNYIKYPKLNILARRYLIGQAISVSSEKVISTAKKISTEKRNGIARDMFDKLIFIHCNNLM